MFRVILYCDDKKLGELLAAATGIAIGQPTVLHVVNAEAKAGKIKARTNGNLVEMFVAHLKENRIKQFTAREGAGFVKAFGRSPKSANYVFVDLMKAGVLKRFGKSSATRYTVIK